MDPIYKKEYRRKVTTSESVITTPENLNGISQQRPLHRSRADGHGFARRGLQLNLVACALLLIVMHSLGLENLNRLLEETRDVQRTRHLTLAGNHVAHAGHLLLSPSRSVDALQQLADLVGRAESVPIKRQDVAAALPHAVEEVAVSAIEALKVCERDAFFTAPAAVGNALLADGRRRVQVDGKVRQRQVLQAAAAKLVVVGVALLVDVAVDGVDIGKHAVAEDRAIENDTLASLQDVTQSVDVCAETLAVDPELQLQRVQMRLLVKGLEIRVCDHGLKHDEVVELAANVRRQGGLAHTDVSLEDDEVRTRCRCRGRGGNLLGGGSEHFLLDDDGLKLD
eukprot:m.149049 g.149049  ORF g.149049 m.149049 type:complete len:339 (+) comp16846_c0_seq7:412-1428(+)